MYGKKNKYIFVNKYLFLVQEFNFENRIVFVNATQIISIGILQVFSVTTLTIIQQNSSSKL